MKPLPAHASLYQINTRVWLRGLYLDMPPWSYHVFELSADE